MAENVKCKFQTDGQCKKVLCSDFWTLEESCQPNDSSLGLQLANTLPGTHKLCYQTFKMAQLCGNNWQQLGKSHFLLPFDLVIWARDMCVHGDLL